MLIEFWNQVGTDFIFPQTYYKNMAIGFALNKDLAPHIGHDIAIVDDYNGKLIYIKCNTCICVVIDGCDTPEQVIDRSKDHLIEWEVSDETFNNFFNIA